MKKEVICHTHGFFSHRSDKNSSSSNNNSNSNSNSSSNNSNSNKRETSRWIDLADPLATRWRWYESSPQRQVKIFENYAAAILCSIRRCAAAVKNCNLPLQVPLIWRWRSPAAHLNIYKYRTYSTYFYDFTIFPASFCNSFFRLNSTSPPRAPPPLGAEQLQNEDCLSANRTAEGVRAYLMDVLFSHTKCLSRTITQSTPR